MDTDERGWGEKNIEFGVSGLSDEEFAELADAVFLLYDAEEEEK